eukprot:GHVU01074465.1.p1 GENE.GHVU01074465.1~~GHVU01074465.1.p1  ORF type:complete len:177 (-),score=17.83 GHVU01074465.1:18-548(-)
MTRPGPASARRAHVAVRGGRVRPTHDIVPVFYPLLTLLRSTDSQKAGLAGKYMVRLQQQEAELEAALQIFPPNVKTTVMSMVRKRRKESHNRLYSVAFLLDPEYVGRNRAELVGEEWARRAHVDWNDWVSSLPSSERSEVEDGKSVFDVSGQSFGAQFHKKTTRTEPKRYRNLSRD